MVSKAVKLNVHKKGADWIIYGETKELCTAVRNWNISIYTAMEWSSEYSVSEKKSSEENHM